ncbi:MAG: reductive dehalogenase domain-containing protein [Anaerolineae bacterium]|jgi:reductive dehalogenase
MTTVGLVVIGFVILLGFGAFALVSLREGERRAATIALALAVAGSLPIFLFTLLPDGGQWIVLGVVGLAAVVGAILFLLPIGRAEWGNDEPKARIDERDIMFARARLEPGTANYDAYYALRPENRASDDKTRSLPGLLSPEASEANPLVYAATDASFELCGVLDRAVDGPVVANRVDHDPAAITATVKALARYWGARAVGVAELRPYHIYTNVGRGSGEYGAPVTLNHRYAVAFTVEMDHALVGTAPAAPTLLESAHQYAAAAQLAVQLALFVRSQGYPARAHIDGDYCVVAPLVARDAGLGEIGRMGLLMTPDLGPRVRLGVVTTDLPLVVDGRHVDSSVLDFCRICTKCADNCPVRAIPGGDRQEIGGVLRWRCNQEICYRYWCTTGTDCARCVAVCPYSHPDTPLHNLVRWPVRRSGATRRVVLWLDDLFYGSKPKPKAAPGWLPPRPSKSGKSQTCPTRMR